MKTTIVVLGMFLLGVFATQASAEEVSVAPPGSKIPGAITNLDSLLTNPADGMVVNFAPGVYDLQPVSYTEEDCGNCEAESTQVTATRGLKVTGRGIWLVGPEEGQAVIRTRAGYGILFEDCRSCQINGLTITGGVRDPDPNATDAAIVVKRSQVTISDCDIQDNIGDAATVNRVVVGIMGIAGRERSNIIVRDNRIFRNSWDGIALYRGSQAVIEGNIIDGVDLARGNQVGGGRGVGIGLTWNSFATVRGNLVRNYWKGIGVFVDAQATIEENVIEHMATWGLTLWDAGEGLPSGTFRRNVVYKTGACGASIARGRSELNPGQFVQNVLVSTAQDPKYDSGEPYCLQVPIDQHGVPENFPISANVLFQNREAGKARYRDDLPRAAFEARMQPIWNALDRWPRLSKSDFWRTFHPEPKEPVEAVPQTNEGATPTGDPPN